MMVLPIIHTLLLTILVTVISSACSPPKACSPMQLHPLAMPLPTSIHHKRQEKDSVKVGDTSQGMDLDLFLQKLASWETEVSTSESGPLEGNTHRKRRT